MLPARPVASFTYRKWTIGVDCTTFGEILVLDAVLASAERCEQSVNGATTAASLAHEERLTGYFSDRENGPRARAEQVISPTVWAGLAGTVQALINSGAFGLRFLERCLDGQAICGCDSDTFAASVSAEMPGLAWPPNEYALHTGNEFAQLDGHGSILLVRLCDPRITATAALHQTSTATGAPSRHPCSEKGRRYYGSVRRPEDSARPPLLATD